MSAVWKLLLCDLDFFPDARIQFLHDDPVALLCIIFFGSVCFFFDYCYYYCCCCCWFILVTLISIALGFFMVARAISALKRISYWSLCERSSLDRSSVYLIHMLMAFELIRFG